MILWMFWSLLTLAAVISAGHALLHKRDPRAALGWIVTCLALPGIGVVCYWLLGVNRIRTRARVWQAAGRGMYWLESIPARPGHAPDPAPPFTDPALAGLRSLSDRVTRRPLLAGNRLEILHNGEAAYPAMLAAITAAQQSVFLSSYIFDSDRTGRQFVQALVAAAERGVEVRVLVDALGEYYSLPATRRLFRGTKVRIARFLPPSFSGRGIYLNLRNHRKLLIVDGQTGFAGGMNIGDRHLVEGEGKHRVVDLHFAIHGPVVGQMQEVFLEDWHFATGEAFDDIISPPKLPDGRVFARGISAGPNEDFEKLNWIIIGALNGARQRVSIMTPYFIPSQQLITALNATALRGVWVEIILPSQNNLPYVAWASRAYLWELLQKGINIYDQPPPFVHSKLFLVDDAYALVGSANLDPRSLRLNFEFNLELYDRDLCSRLQQHFAAVRDRSHRTSLLEVDSRPLPIKLRDATAKLFSPYL